MGKERSVNPVLAQRKADKKKEIRKGKAELQARRNEKLAKRNPERIQKQIDDLKQIASSGGKLTKHEESVLEGLERELSAVLKARKTLGDNAPTFQNQHDGARRPGGGVLGKRMRNGLESSDDSDVPEDVRKIPMPRDTPPPISKHIMDEWHAKRRARWQARQERFRQEQQDKADDHHELQKGPTNQGANKALQPQPIVAKTVYEAPPQIRDLRKEAVSAFVPNVVRMKMQKANGLVGLIEPEEADRLEREGYLPAASRQAKVDSVEDEAGS